MTFDLDASLVKAQAKEFGADLVGVVSADTLNNFRRIRNGRKRRTVFPNT